MPDDHGLAMPQVTGVDDQFGTHTRTATRPTCTNAAATTCSLSRTTDPSCAPNWLGCPGATSRPSTSTRTKGMAESRHAPWKLTAIGSGIIFPHAQLAAQIMRRQRPNTSAATDTWHTETLHAVTDLGFGDVCADQLAETIREHWSIENKLHWIRDVTFAEDHSQIHTGNGPAVMATLRNFALSRHRINGHTNIAAACRYTSRHPIRAADLLT
jgi:predicted transposase YbfD/YdcC